MLRENRKYRRGGGVAIFIVSLVPTINKPTRVTNKTISAINHIITNSVYNNDFKTAIIRTDTDHFPITYAFKLRSSTSSENHQKNRYLYKRIINESSKATFKCRLRETSWDADTGLDNREAATGNSEENTCARVFFRIKLQFL